MPNHTRNVLVLAEAARIAAALHYDEDHTPDKGIGPDEICKAEDEQSAAEYNFVPDEVPTWLRPAFKVAATEMPDEFAGCLEDEETDVPEILGAVHTLDGHNDEDLAAAWAVVLWGESQGMADREVMCELFEDVLLAQFQTAVVPRGSTKRQNEEALGNTPKRT
jgi:hypothetical protein